jgi:DNA-binding SARP family transcriptional activator
LFGGFDVRLDSRVVRSFESQKVRGLFAYLACHRRQALTRDRLAALLWGERPEEMARRNLRQALHNLRSAFAVCGDPDEILKVSPKDLQIHPDLDCWLDVEDFHNAVQGGITAAGPDPYQLSTAARLYTGDFLAGFFVKDCQSFEEWLVTEQEGLREVAIEAYRTLIEHHLERREYPVGIQYARRLLAIDPLSEHAHRELMELYSLSGRRTTALAQYQKLRNLLEIELGVEPIEQTTTLYHSILEQEVAVGREDAEEEPAGPLIPLVGRSEEYLELQRHWRKVVAGQGRMTIVTGEAGVGKSRLIRSFTDAASAKRRALVLQGHAHGAAARRAYRPFAEVVASAFAELLPQEQQALVRHFDSESAACLTRLAPEICQQVPALADSSAEEVSPSSSRLARSILNLLEALSLHMDDLDEPLPVIVLMDDLHDLDSGSLALLRNLLPQISERRIWILAAARSPVAGQVSPGLDETLAARLPVERLSAAEVDEISYALVGSRGAERLSSFLERWGDGLPLTVVELINFLWDEGILAPSGPGRWLVRDEIQDLTPPSGDLQELVQHRIRRLPTSTRRLLAVAAIIGQRFDADLMQAADGEHPEVVEVCLQLLLGRWLIRQAPQTWSKQGRERDLVLWARGARRGTFEFSHEEIREAVLQDINPIRKQALHRAVARALESSRGEDAESLCEDLAHHTLAAGDWQNALPHIESAAHRAVDLGATEIAGWYCDRGLQVFERLLQDDPGAAADQDLSAKKRRMTQLMEQIADRQTA